MLKRGICALAMLLAGCAVKAPVTRQIETFEQMLVRTEGVTCADLTVHDYEPAPDCRRVYDALSRGRQRVASRLNPLAADLKLSACYVYRPQLHWVEDKPYPLILSGMAEGSPNYYVRATFSPVGIIYYAAPESLEHEGAHCFTRLVDGRQRTPEAIAADPGTAPPDPPMLMVWEIVCHNTPDDKVGDGPPGNRGDCSLPYAGPPRPVPTSTGGYTK